MPLLQWNDNFSVGVAEIDAQHKNLVSYLNDLHFAMTQGKGNSILKSLLDRLVGYTQVHFATEEKYMKQWNYPGYVYHKGEHEVFVKKVAEFKTKFEGGQAVLSIEILSFLKDWVVKHIQGTDKKYGPFFNKHGLK
ncbi:MAG: bacteriohemerythrin [Candidatus Bathyarchaeota archaeon]|nr:bacteriohemerythrin [Candidatus Bathyarchaeota archaeon]